MSESPLSNPSATKLRVGGLTRLSTCDWPGELSAVVFCQGCAWDCAYCHNPGLRTMHAETFILWPEILAFLQSRRGLLDAVVFSGGEPTLQPALLDAVHAVRDLGFRVGLHTAGITPERFEALLPWIDWVGFDVKAPFGAYARITGVDGSGDKALASLRLLLTSGIPYEVRTTFHPALLTLADLIELRDQLLSLGVTHDVIQQFRAAGTREGRLLPLPEQQQLNLPSSYGSGFLEFHVR